MLIERLPCARHCTSALQGLNEGIYAKHKEHVVSVQYVGSCYYHYYQEASIYMECVLHRPWGEVRWGGDCKNMSNV